MENSGERCHRESELLSRLFGSYPHERITVSEVLLPMSIAYPASLHLSVGTWITTDQWGYERLHRAHEVPISGGEPEWGMSHIATMVVRRIRRVQFFHVSAGGRGKSAIPRSP